MLHVVNTYWHKLRVIMCEYSFGQVHPENEFILFSLWDGPSWMASSLELGFVEDNMYNNIIIKVRATIQYLLLHEFSLGC